MVLNRNIRFFRMRTNIPREFSIVHIAQLFRWFTRRWARIMWMAYNSYTWGKDCPQYNRFGSFYSIFVWMCPSCIHLIYCCFFYFRTFSNPTIVELIIWKFVMGIGISHRYWADIVVPAGLWNWLNLAAVECCSLWKRHTDKLDYVVLQLAMKVRYSFCL